jgi:osmotically-inducible protein OsmY
VDPSSGPRWTGDLDRVRERSLGPQLRAESGRVRVSTTNGVVTLSGSVRDDPRSRRIEVLVNPSAAWSPW